MYLFRFGFMAGFISRSWGEDGRFSHPFPQNLILFDHVAPSMVFLISKTLWIFNSALHPELTSEAIVTLSLFKQIYFFNFSITFH